MRGNLTVIIASDNVYKSAILNALHFKLSNKHVVSLEGRPNYGCNLNLNNVILASHGSSPAQLGLFLLHGPNLSLVGNGLAHTGVSRKFQD